MAVDEMSRRRPAAPTALDTRFSADPRVHADALPGGVGEHRRERIEGRRLPRQIRGARLEIARVVGVAAAAHLHEQRVEAVVVRGLHQGAMLAGDWSGTSAVTQSARISELVGPAAIGRGPDGAVAHAAPAAASASAARRSQIMTSANFI